MGAIVHAGNFQDVIFETLQGEATAGKTLDKIMQPYTLSSADGDANMRDFLVFVAVKILLPMAVLLGIVIAIL